MVVVVVDKTWCTSRATQCNFGLKSDIIVCEQCVDVGWRCDLWARSDVRHARRSKVLKSNLGFLRIVYSVSLLMFFFSDLHRQHSLLWNLFCKLTCYWQISKCIHVMKYASVVEDLNSRRLNFVHHWGCRIHGGNGSQPESCSTTRVKFPRCIGFEIWSVWCSCLQVIYRFYRLYFF